MAFYCNNAENVSTKFSAQLLMMGRLPTWPIDATIGNKEWTEMPNHSQHVEILLETETELRRLAHENDKQSKAERNEGRNRSSKHPSFKKGSG